MEKSLKLVLAIHSLSAGGAERVMTTMANYWAEKGWQITIVTQHDEEPFYTLNPEVTHVSLDSARRSNSLLKAIVGNSIVILKLIRLSRVASPDVIISFTTSMNILCIITSKFLNIPIIVSERYNPYKFLPARIWRVARRLIYPMADFVVVQSEQSESFFTRFCKKRRVKVIYNSVNKEVVNNFIPQHRENMILSVGRLEYVKGHDLLVKAFAKSRIEGWQLYIVGEGKEREKLKELIAALGLEGSVFLPGRSETVEEYYQRAGMFVLSSRAEGFPNCLLEAMSCGLPVISTDCETGPSVIIKNGENGLLVPNKDIGSLASAMNYLVENPGVRTKLSDSAISSMDRFEVATVMEQWEELIETSLLKGNS